MTTETVICGKHGIFSILEGFSAAWFLYDGLNPGLVFDQDPLTWLLRSYDLVKHDLVSPDFIIAPIDPNIKKNIIENTLRHLVETSLFSVKSGVGKTLTITQYHTL